MTTKQATGPDIHALTVAEIARQRAALSERRRLITGELVEIFEAFGLGGVPQSTPLKRNARARAAELLNGHAPDFLKHAMPSPEREAELLAEREAIDIADGVLARFETQALAVEAAQWAEEHAEEWSLLCKDVIITATRLAALERRAEEMIKAFLGRIPRGGLALDGRIGDGRGFCAYWPEQTLPELQREALSEGVITAADIKRAKDV